MKKAYVHHEISGKDYGWHDKHNSWVIYRCNASVNLTGGSWFEPGRFKTEEEIVAYLDTKPKPIRDHECHNFIEFKTDFRIAHCSKCCKRLTAA